MSKTGSFYKYAGKADNVRNQTVQSTNVSNPPTDAELDAAFGTPATVGAGYTVIIDDNGAGSNFYECISDGSNWWISTFTKAV